ncbi:hypothetical protein HY501_02155 [Candidatus Woesearchaeota archaeon]|nr:hypothetical protein [Candidatus Woesearchaeota archaeon]
MTDNHQPKLESLVAENARYREHSRAIEQAYEIALQLQDSGSRKRLGLDDVKEFDRLASMVMQGEEELGRFCIPPQKAMLEAVRKTYNTWSDLSALDYLVVPGFTKPHQFGMAIGARKFPQWRELFDPFARPAAGLDTPFASLPDAYRAFRGMMEECIRLYKQYFPNEPNNLLPVDKKGKIEYHKLIERLNEHCGLIAALSAMAEDRSRVPDMSRAKALWDTVGEIRNKMNQGIVVDTELRYGGVPTNSFRSDITDFSSTTLYHHALPITSTTSIPVYQQRRLETISGLPIKDMTDDIEKNNLLGLLFDKAADLQPILPVLEFISGKPQDRITIFSPTEEERREDRHRVVSLGYHGLDFSLGLSTKQDYLAYALAIDRLKQQWVVYKQGTGDNKQAAAGEK